MNTKKPDPYGMFLDSYIKELVETPDTEILASEKGLSEPGFGKKLLARARSEGARRRMSLAKAGVDAARNRPIANARRALTAATARELLAKYAGEPSLTLAARNLEELNDEEAIRLAQQIQQLVDESENPGTDGV